MEYETDFTHSDPSEDDIFKAGNFVINPDETYVILVTDGKPRGNDSFSGTVIAKKQGIMLGNPCPHPIGHNSNQFIKKCFKPFNGEITITS